MTKPVSKSIKPIFCQCVKASLNTPTPTKIMVKGESCHNTCVVVGVI